MQVASLSGSHAWVGFFLHYDNYNYPHIQSQETKVSTLIFVNVVSYKSYPMSYRFITMSI